MNEEKTVTAAAAPTVAYLLGLIAGVLVVLNGLFLVLTGATLGLALGDGALPFGLAGAVVGAAMIVAALSLDARPDRHVRWGAVLIAGSAASLVLVGGGFLIGFILGLVAGILAMAWRY